MHAALGLDVPDRHDHGHLLGDDAAGNTAAKTFTVNVRSGLEQLTLLKNDLAAANINSSLQSLLVSELGDA